jgi:nucleoside-diphosphate-sugar epimerase
MIFFTGASGFIGSHFHEAIPNEEIINFDINEPIFPTNSTYIKGNIRNIDDIDSALSSYKSDIIISLAAEHKDFGISEEEYFLTNEFGTKNICKMASKHGINKLIFFSSVAVYGGNKDASDENMTPTPNLPYGHSKLAGEVVLRKWAAENPLRSVIIIRPAVVYGERNVANMFRLIMQIKVGRFFNIGEGANVKSIAYCKNLVDATLFLKDNMKSGVEIYNYADEPQMTSREIANTIAKFLGKKSPITLPYWFVYVMGIPFDILIWVTKKDLPISTNRIKKLSTETKHLAYKIKETGFNPKYTNLDGLKNMVEWMKNDYKSNQKYFDI